MPPIPFHNLATIEANTGPQAGISVPPASPSGSTFRLDGIRGPGAPAAAQALPCNPCTTNTELPSGGESVRKPPLSKRTVLALPEEYTTKGVSSQGKKEDLIARLRDFCESQTATTLGKAGVPSGPVAVPAGAQAPMITKNECTRLFHFMATANIAVVVSRGALSLQQLDAGVAKHDQWSLFVASTFNDPTEKLVTPPSFLAYGFNPNLDPLFRSGTKLKVNLSEVSLDLST